MSRSWESVVAKTQLTHPPQSLDQGVIDDPPFGSRDRDRSVYGVPDFHGC